VELHERKRKGTDALRADNKSVRDAAQEEDLTQQCFMLNSGASLWSWIRSVGAGNDPRGDGEWRSKLTT
jgi:hypothetical protein